MAAVVRGPGVQATTMPDGNDREHDGQYRQGHGFGGEDAPARRAHGEIVLTPVRGVKAARNLPTVQRQVCPGRCLQAWCRRGSNPQPRSLETCGPVHGAGCLVRAAQILLGEVNLPFEQARTFFGDEDGDELTMLVDFPTMQAMCLGLAREGAGPIRSALLARPENPSDSRSSSATTTS